jgi:hypothetical protein
LLVLHNAGERNQPLCESGKAENDEGEGFHF